MLFPDGLADALAMVIAGKEREFKKLLEAQAAEYRAAFAEYRADVAKERLAERDRLADLEAKIHAYERIITDALANVQNGKEGAAGRDGSPGEPGIAGEKGEKGDPGERGEKGEPGEKGELGEPGPPGDRGDPGAKGDAGAAGAPGAPGVKGDKGDPGERGGDGAKGDTGTPGRDGLPGVPGRDGKDGAAGRDGLGFDSWSVDYDGERTVTFIVGSGELTKRHAITLPIQIHRGVFDIEREYKQHDVVTFGGSQWIANTDTTGVQPDTLKTRDWTMVVRKGRDGRDGKSGDRGEKGEPGRPGLDLTQMDSSGNKWR